MLQNGTRWHGGLCSLICHLAGVIVSGERHEGTKGELYMYRVDPHVFRRGQATAIVASRR